MQLTNGKFIILWQFSSLITFHVASKHFCEPSLGTDGILDVLTLIVLEEGGGIESCNAKFSKNACVLTILPLI